MPAIPRGPAADTAKASVLTPWHERSAALITGAGISHGAHFPAGRTHCPEDRWVCAGTVEAGGNRNRTGWLDNRDAMLLLVVTAV
jgi:hypothetical protein